MNSALMFRNKSIKPTNNNLRPWLYKASKEERMEMARQIASTVETTDEELSYIDTANLHDMPKEERTRLAKKIVSSIPHGRGYTGC